MRQSPARTIAIGDEIRDIDAAHQAGLTAGVMTFGYNSRAALERRGPEYLFDDYEALRRAVIG
jgi:phosphoglycolate phosphatase